MKISFDLLNQVSTNFPTVTHDRCAAYGYVFNIMTQCDQYSYYNMHSISIRQLTLVQRSYYSFSDDIDFVFDFSLFCCWLIVLCFINITDCVLMIVIIITSVIRDVEFEISKFNYNKGIYYEMV